MENHVRFENACYEHQFIFYFGDNNSVPNNYVFAFGRFHARILAFVFNVVYFLLII